jgi:outer membrane protein assembly factor BamA
MIQSFKSSNVQYTYTMPEFFGEDLSFAVDGHALVRDEISFRREEWGSEVRLTKEFGSRTQASVGYRLEKLDSRRFLMASDSPTRVESRVGSLQLSFSRDTRDNPLYPSSGTQFRTDLELGSEFLGADVTYQRFNIMISHHRTLRPGLRIHSRIAHGFAATWGSDAEDLPLNRRFYPGGVNSIRGYRPGVASPVDSAGQYIGAESFILTQAEIEQDLSPSISGVLFIDYLIFARSIGDYPGNESLLTLGTGLRYRTIVGPLRVEGGWNVERREIDPTYKIQISLGFPF